MKILRFLLRLLFMFWIPLVVIVIGIIVGLITRNALAGFWTIGAEIILLFLYGVYKSIEDDRRLRNERPDNKEE